MKDFQASQYLYTELIPLKVPPLEIKNEFSKKVNLPIDTSFLSVERLFQIFSHKSFTHENPSFNLNNERLEFVGDAVLDLLVGGQIFKRYPESSEGELSKLRSSLVNEKSLADFAFKINIGAHVLLGKGELKLMGHEKASILSDTFEALLGGVYIDHGFEKTESFFDDLLEYLNEKHRFDFLSSASLELFDAKTKLQEITMKDFKEVPIYHVEDVTNDDGPKFKVQIFIKDQLISSLLGDSKKKTMQKLAQKVLDEKLLEKYSEKLCY